MKKELAIICGSVAICCSAAPQPAVAFRFDDNHTVRIWETLASVFRKHDARFSASIIPYWNNDIKKSDWCQKICQLESEGFEIMDHTPQHTTITVTLPKDDPRLEKLKTAPFVDHINNGKVCLKYSPSISKYSEPFTVKIFDRNKVSSTSKMARRMNLEIDGKHYYLAPTAKQDVFQLLTIWNENNVNLPDGEKSARRCLGERFELTDGGYDFLIECSQDGFRRIGLKKMPQVWIQPGGYYPHLGFEKLSAALRKHNYLSASCAQNISMKGFADPDFENSRFSMRWGDFNLEKLSLDIPKTRIANNVALRKVSICSSHVSPERKFGKLKEYAAVYDQLLPWLKQNNIKVMTQSELAVHLRDTKIDPNENVMPSLANDIDGNNLPDGYYLSRGSKWDKAGKSVVLKGKGALLKVTELCGLPRGKVKLQLENKGSFSGNVSVQLIDSQKKPCAPPTVLSLNGKNVDWKKYEMQLNIPADCAALNLVIQSNQPANCNFRNFDLRGF